MFKFLCNFFSYFYKKPCTHEGCYQRKWLDENDTPMVTTICDKCGFRDEGHVYADPRTWLDI
jgi:hypothetical protein